MSEIRMLRTFLAIEKHGTMAAAADRMALTHAAVGAQMRTLERVCARQLFDRSGRSIQLNDAGRSIIEQARAVVKPAWKARSRSARPCRRWAFWRPT
jgi:DNA-binding transcriptional LysR family regulator